MREENRIINGFWLGKLGAMEQLTIRSFIHFGHELHLWNYDREVSELPAHTILHDASEIIPQERVFRYRNNSMPWGSGSYGGFSDIFRYKLLHERGGWWVDMDVTCLKPLDFPEPYFFRNHWQLKVVGNVMKCPPGSELMKKCFEQSSKEVTADNTDWHKPIKILNENIENLELMNYRRLGLFNLDMLHTIKPYFESNLPIPDDWYGIHWINSAGKINFKKGSTYDLLLNQYGLSNAQLSNSGQ
jgi:hypothetical protein